MQLLQSKSLKRQRYSNNNVFTFNETHNKREVKLIFKIKYLVRIFLKIFLDLLMILLGDQVYFVGKLVGL